MTMQVEINIRAFASAYPVGLLDFYSFNKINGVQIIKKSLSIICYFQHPLVFGFSYNFAAAAFAYAVYDFFIRKTDFAACAEIYRKFFFIRKSRFKKLEENPLRPFVVFGIGCVNLSRPVKRVTE
jgi:hypothetical protein